jgi:hypothetical protein
VAAAAPVAASTEAMASATTTEAMSSAETAATTGGSTGVATAEATHRTATEAGVIVRSDSHGRALRRRKAPCRSSLRRSSR